MGVFTLKLIRRIGMEFHNVYSVSNASQWMNNLKVDKANQKNARIGGLNQRHKEVWKSTMKH